MDKEKVLLLTKKSNKEYIDPEKAIELIVDYCVEMGKDPIKSEQFAIFIINLGIAAEYISTALEYYQKKYNLCFITDKAGKVITII